MPFKMGHGGTLDPLATGILIVGIGRGTKHLGDFLNCTKTYETVVIFGKATDTYDIVGKVVAEAPHTHITRQLLEEKLVQFRGKIKQVPPIYSALKINGMKAYEYARSGKELPRQLESRDMEVTQCEIVEWLEPGQHDYRWPAEEASADDREAASKLLKASSPEKISQGQTKHTAETTQTSQPSSAAQAPEAQAPPSKASPPSTAPSKSLQHTHAVGPLSSLPCPGPAAVIRLTVSSGFYVRSFAHDLGRALDSYGIMASLCRSRQANFYVANPEQTTDTNQQLDVHTREALTEALPYTDLALGEATWSPKLTAILTKWIDAHPQPIAEGVGSSANTEFRIHHGIRALPSQQRGSAGSRSNNEREYGHRSERGSGMRSGQLSSKRRRNSSSSGSA